MDLIDLNPGPVLTRVGDLIFKLRLFDLRAVVWAESFFSESDRGGLNAMYYILNNPEKWNVFSSTVADVAFYLAEDLAIKTPEEFKKKINVSNPPQAIAILNQSITEVLEKSFPKGNKTAITGGELFKKAVQNEEQKKTDWANVYAEFYRAGGISIDRFYSLTMLQIDAIYRRIDEGRTREKIENMQFQCSIHGIKKQNWPKMPQRKIETKEIDQDEIKRRQEEHKKLFGDDDKWPAQ
jgi:hypothetical protein